MIKILVEKDSYISKFEIKGHANYSEHGSDIVCAAVSSALLTTVNAIMSFDQSIIDYEENEGFALVTCNYYNEVVDKLLVNLYNVLLELSKEYPKNIKIN